MTALIQDFGLAVRHFREHHGWSQELLAEKADLNRSYLGEVERGRAIPSLATAAKLAAALGIPLSGLLAHCEQQAA
ncbi:helix-turn-helix domain-containing protein [Quatrionicoccus australiensis]|uniref:helix-turn-helix domain-containing protein n=1 Tax=Quatrionicoccus australiensis TaxID=138118 RepID=UPI001CFACC06|nr:helix-turn-helix transcriptional regulator [Quatrionicoccus australiensis]MCB4358808.1 helix-turn-helix transcriptional regulator [Quatrionicoccus australiensis]